MIAASLLGPGLALAAPAKPAQDITMKGCIKKALENSLPLKIQRIDEKRLALSAGIERGKFYPVLNAEFVFDHEKDISPYAYSDDDGLFENSALGYKLGLTGLLPTGTTYDLGLSSNVGWSGMTSSLFDQQHASALSLTLTQPLLRGFGWDTTLGALHAARLDHRSSTQDTHGQITKVLAGVLQAYWELVYQGENVKIARRSLSLAEDLRKLIQRRVRAGTMSPLDVIEAKAAIAARREALLTAQMSAKTAETKLLEYILPAKQRLRGADLRRSFRPVDSPKAIPVKRSLDQLISLALKRRPEIRAAALTMKARRARRDAARMNALPQLDLSVQGGFRSLAGNPRCAVGDATCSRPGDFMTGDHWTAWGQVFGADVPFIQVGLALALPLQSDARDGTHQLARLKHRRARAELLRIQADVALETRNLFYMARSTTELVQVARQRQELARDNLAAAEKKFRSGVFASNDVLRVQLELGNAQIANIKAARDQAIARTNLMAAVGLLPEEHGIKIK